MKGEGFDEGSKQKKILHEQGSLPHSPALLMDRMKTQKMRLKPLIPITEKKEASKKEAQKGQTYIQK